MHSLRFNHVFFALLFFCALSAFILPRFVDPARAQIQNIYFPISRPTRLIAQWARGRFDRQRVVDQASPLSPRSDSDLRTENDELRQDIASLSSQLQKLQELESQRASLGTLGNLCTPFSATAGDSGTAESLVISGTTFSGLRSGMPVVYPEGLVGRLETPGLTGTRLRLITDRGFGDRGFSMTGLFKRWQKQSNGKLQLVTISNEQYLGRGAGKNSLIIDNLPITLGKQIAVNDWFVLDDDSWPLPVQGQRIGRVMDPPTSSHAYPGFDEVHLEPATTLMQLPQVMVVTKAK